MKRSILYLVVYLIYCVLFLLIVLFHVDPPKNFQANPIKKYVSNYPMYLSEDFYSGLDGDDTSERNLDDPPDDGSSPDDPPSDEDDIELSKRVVLTLNDIDEISLIEDWCRDVLFTLIYDNNYTLLEQNIVINDPVIYFGVRQTKPYTNSNSNTNKVIPSYITNDEFDVYTKMGNKARKDNITLSTGEILEYTPEGPHGTLADAGGYIISLPRNATEASNLNYSQERELLNPRWVNMYFFYMTINRNTNDLALNAVLFNKLPSGQIENRYDIAATRFRYQTSLEKFMLFVE